MRRPRVEWMTAADDVILEFLQNDPGDAIRASPAVVEANISYKISHIRTRLRKLHEHGLVDYYDDESGIYQITERGRAYLEGELDASDIVDED